MEDVSLRAAFHRALEPVAPPAPWLSDSVMKDLRARRDAYRAVARRRRLAWAPPEGTSRLAAVALILIIVMASLAAFLGVNLFIHNSVPVQFPHAVSRACGSSDYVITPDGAQWESGVGAVFGINPGGWARSTDGGVTWQSIAPPHVPGYLGGGDTLCIVDTTHAWSAEIASAPVSACGGAAECRNVAILSTADAGRTWQPVANVPVPSGSPSTLVDFADDQRGWLFTDTGSGTFPEQQRTLYATSDGGRHWKRLASANLNDGSPLGKTAFGCGVSGVVMTASDDGWITWNCPRPAAASAPPTVIATHDGGLTWAYVTLPGAPGLEIAACGFEPPVLSGQSGALPFSCSGGLTPNNGVYRTGDGGRTWALGQVIAARILQFDFPDGLDGFFAVPRAANPPTSGATFYATSNGGRTWRVVASGLFPGQGIGGLYFVDSSRGYLQTQGHLWRTADGGVTWTVQPPYHSVGTTVCSLAPPPVAGGAELTTPRMFGASMGWDAGGRHTSDGGAHWATSVPAAPKLSTSGYGEYFLDGTDAWIVQAVGSPLACSDHVFVYRTSDGAQSWAKVASITVPPKAPASEWTPSVFFLDRLHGWVYATSGALFRTVDGGATWTAVPTNVLAANTTGCTAGPAMSFATASDGWLSLHCWDPVSGTNNPGPYRLLATHDGGATWTVVTIASNLLTVDSLAPTFFDARHGYVWDQPFGMLAVTSDGGRSWSVRTPPLAGYPCVGKGGTTMFCSNDQVMGLSFVNPSAGWALVGTFSFPQGKGGPVNENYRFERTTNGGLTWTVYSRLPTMSAPDGNGGTSLQFVDSQTAFWMNGTKWSISHDGGRTWRLVFTGVGPQ